MSPKEKKIILDSKSFFQIYVSINFHQPVKICYSEFFNGGDGNGGDLQYGGGFR
jgi:hypothetical protein